MLVYFAGPLFCEAEKTFNARLAERIEALGYRVYLPQRDGVESTKPPYDAMTLDERRTAVFELDRDQILASDVFMFVLDGRVPDEGACVELGIAYTQRFLGALSRPACGALAVPVVGLLERHSPDALGDLLHPPEFAQGLDSQKHQP